MAEIYKVIVPFKIQIGYGGIGLIQAFSKGDLFYKEPSTIIKGTNDYHPFNGSYAVGDGTIRVEEYVKKLCDTNKPKEYYIKKCYSQYELDKIKMRQKRTPK